MNGLRWKLYHPKLVERRLATMADHIRQTLDPKFEFRDIEAGVRAETVENLEKIWNPETMSLARSLNQAETEFIRHEINRSKVDFLYWCTSYAKIKDKNMNLVTLQPTSVQNLMLDRFGKAEWHSVIEKSGDGIMFLCLKARQLGASTLSDVIISHRIFFYANTTAMIAADVEERTPNLYEMVIRCLKNLPWWMQPRSADPKRDYQVKGKQIYFADQDSMIRFSSSANTQGGSSGEVKGSIGTGMTLPLVHLSELALWKNPYQIDDALMPSIPRGPRTFVIFESTAKGRDNWWYDTWQDSKKGLGRCRPIFVPWYTDPDTYREPAPANWSPSSQSEAHAARVAETSHRWVDKTIHLTRDQLYWWEKTRTEYDSKRVLYKFLAEYCSDDEEAFQNTTHGVFPTGLIADMRDRAKQPVFIDVQKRVDTHV